MNLSKPVDIDTFKFASVSYCQEFEVVRSFYNFNYGESAIIKNRKGEIYL